MNGSEHHYQDAAGRSYHRNKRGIPPAAYPWVARLRADKFKPYVRPTDVVFEFGVGSGWNLAALPCARRLGHDVAAFLESRLADQKIEFIAATQQLDAASIDVAICHHTLEHVIDPAAVLRELHRLLRANGTLMLAVPYEKERRYHFYQPDEPNHHLFSWNCQTLGNLAVETGFELDSVRLGQFGYDRFAAVWSHRLHQGERAYRCIRALALWLRPCREVRLVAHPALIQPARHATSASQPGSQIPDKPASEKIAR